MRPTALPEEEIEARLSNLDRWHRAGHAIRRTFRFDDFVAAFGWMTRVALHAEKLNHHPDWKNVFNTVEVELSTHDAGALTSLDFELAERMDALYDG